MFKIKRDLNSIIERHRSFFNCEEVKRPLFCISVAGKGFAEAYSRTFGKITKNKEVLPEDIDIENYIKDVDDFISWTEEIGVDMFYPVSPFLYIPWMEAIVGCPIYTGKDSFYTKPCIKNWEDFDWKINLSENNRWLKKLLEMTEALVDHLEGRYPIASSTHLRGPADIMSAAIGQKEFPLELYDNPENIKKIGKIYTDAFISVARMLNNIARKSKFAGFIVNIFGIWTYDVCQFFQDDAVVFLSPRFYREFILKNHLTIDSSFSSTLYHIHPTTLFVVDELIKFPNLKIIEINRDPENISPSLGEMMPYFKKIQESGKALLINFTDIDFSPELIERETKLACENLVYKGLCIFVTVKNIEDGKRILKSVKKIFKV